MIWDYNDEKPFKNEHSARLNDPSKYERFARENDKLGKGIHVIYGIKKGGGSEIQAIRFSSNKFTVAEAKAWLKAHKFHYILFEPASGGRAMEEETNDYKILAIVGSKIIHAKGEDGTDEMFMEGYANTKGTKDRYGDIPTPFKRDFCYDLSEYQKNPVLLIDHQNSVGAIAGSMEKIQEDEKGLFFRAKFSKSDLPLIKHARTVYGEGHGKALSICGQFLHENDEAPEQLTLAKIHEISLVGVGADPNALGAAVSKALKEFKAEATEQETRLEQIYKALQKLDAGVSLSEDELRLIRPFADELRMKVFGTSEVLDPAVFAQRLSELEK